MQYMQAVRELFPKTRDYFWDKAKTVRGHALLYGAGLITAASLLGACDNSENNTVYPTQTPVSRGSAQYTPTPKPAIISSPVPTRSSREYSLGNIPLLPGSSRKSQGSMSNQRTYKYEEWGLMLYDNGFPNAPAIDNILDDFGGRRFGNVDYAIYQIKALQTDIIRFYDNSMRDEGWKLGYTFEQDINPPFKKYKGRAWRNGSAVAIIIVGIDFNEFVYPTSIAVIVAR